MHRAPRWARIVDTLVVAAATLAGIVWAAGGFRFAVGGQRVVITSPYRILLWAGAAALIRHAVRLRPPIHRDIAARLSRWQPPAPLPNGESHLFESPVRPPEGSRSVIGKSRVAEAAAVCLGFFVVAAAATWPQVLRLDSVPDLGDPLFSIWRLSWINHQLPIDPARLLDSNIFYPETRTLTYSDPLVVGWAMAAPLFGLHVRPVVIYNVLLLAAFVLSGAAMYLLARALTGRRDAACVAGLVFVLHPYRFAHYSHLELQMTMWMPLALWGLHRTLARGRIRDGLVTGVAFALQALSSAYYGAMFAAYVAVAGAALWIGRRASIRQLGAIAAAVVIAAALVAPVASQYVGRRAVVRERDPGTVMDFSAQGRDYLRPHARSLVYERWAREGDVERQLFPGIASAALALTGAWPPVSVATMAYTAALAFSVEASLGMNGRLFPWLRNHVPGYGAVRAPARFSMLAGLSLAILCGYGAARLLERWPHRQILILSALLAPLALENLPAMRLQRVWPRPPDIYDSLKGQAPHVLAEFPTPETTGIEWSDLTYQYFSIFHWQKLLNGHSGHLPQSYLDFRRRTADFPSAAALAYLRERGVQYIGWHGAVTTAAVHRRTTIALDARPDLELVATAPWEGSESRMYRLR